MVDKVQTLSIVAGTMACNARCPDCISKMTTAPDMYDAFNFKDVEWNNFEMAVSMAIAGGARAVLITGKGEPTLEPGQINDYLKHLADPQYSQMAIKELQTNGLRIQEKKFQDEDWLKRWYDNNLRVVALSVVDVNDQVNHEFYNPHQEKYPELEKTIDILHDKGYTVRLSGIMTKGRIDSPPDVERVAEYCKKNGVEQLSLRPARYPKEISHDPNVSDWVKNNSISLIQEKQIADYVEANNTRVLENLMHGAVVYDFKGQNLCLTDCLTAKPTESGYRQLIFYSNGMIMYDWSSPAAIVLGMGPKCRAYLKEKNLKKE